MRDKKVFLGNLKNQIDNFPIPSFAHFSYTSLFLFDPVSLVFPELPKTKQLERAERFACPPGPQRYSLETKMFSTKCSSKKSNQTHFHTKFHCNLCSFKANFLRCTINNHDNIFVSAKTHFIRQIDIFIRLASLAK